MSWLVRLVCLASPACLACLACLTYARLACVVGCCLAGRPPGCPAAWLPRLPRLPCLKSCAHPRRSLSFPTAFCPFPTFRLPRVRLAGPVHGVEVHAGAEDAREGEVEGAAEQGGEASHLRKLPQQSTLIAMYRNYIYIYIYIYDIY